MVAAALWNFLEKAANLAQLSGVHAVTLLAVALSLLRIPQCMRERAELEQCVRRLDALMHELPATMSTAGLEIVPRHPVMEGLVLMALRQADSLVGSYDGSTLWCRLRTGRSMARQLREMHDRVDCCCFLLQFTHASVLTQTQAILPPPAHAAAAATTSHEGNVGVGAAAATGAGAEACAAAAVAAHDDTGREGVVGGREADDTDPGCEIVTAILIPDA